MNKVIENLEKGEYLLRVKIKANADTSVSLFGNHRHFLINDLSFKKDEIRDFEFAITIKDADFQKQENYRDNSLSLILSPDAEMSVSIEKASFPVLYTLGDSTVCNQVYTGDGPLYRCAGWGQALSMFLGKSYAVSNHAEQGTHTADCLSCHLLPVLEQIKKGDKVICQFGHNDQKQSFLDAFGGYYDNLIKIGSLVKEKGAEFIICTPINRLIYIDGKLNTYLESWSEAAKKAADTLGVQCIDLHSFTSTLYEKMGTSAENLFYHSPDLDRTHPNDFGAIKIAEYIYKEVIK